MELILAYVYLSSKSVATEKNSLQKNFQNSHVHANKNKK